MIWDVVIEKLIQDGYENISTDNRTANIMAKVSEDGIMDVCTVIKNVDNVFFMAEHITEFNQQMERKFLLKGYKDVQIMHIIYTDKDIDVSKLVDMNGRFWIVDLRNFMLQIFEEQPGDYLELKDKIENELNNESARVLDESKLGNRIKRFPVITAGLILANFVVFIICICNGDVEDIDFMIEAGAMNNELAIFFNEYYRIFTSMFLHFGWEHLINNMFSLLILGNLLERWYGKTRFLTIYLMSGFGGAVASMIYHMITEEVVITAGASGAVYGLFGALIISTIREKDIFHNYGRFIVALVLMFVSGFGDNVDVAAHLGGIITGFIISFILSMDKVKTKKER